MNWTHLFRSFESARQGRSSASSGILRALKTLFGSESGSRRPKAEACGQAERLEVRQVLSVANLAVAMNAAMVSEPEPQKSSFDLPAPEQTETIGEEDTAALKPDSSESLQNNVAESEPIWNQTGISAADRSSFPGVNTSENLLNSSDADSTAKSKFVGITSAPNDPLTSFIDEAFHDSGAILDSSLSSSGIDASGIDASGMDAPDSAASASIVLPVPEVLTPASNAPIPVSAASVVQIAACNLPVTFPGFAMPVAEDPAPASISLTSPPTSGWNWRISSPTGFSARPQQTATVTAGQSLTDSAAVPRSVDRLSIMFISRDADHGRLAGLAEQNWFSAGYESLTSWISSSLVFADALPVAVPLVDSSVDQQLSPQNLTITTQTKVKPFRDGQRQNSTTTKLIEVCYQHDSLPDLIESKDAPRSLKYAVLPRGPPRKQPDTVLRIMDSDAEAHVLQLLRYSIAPRGPSTVTVEMQSPEKRSFSGPRVSPEESLSVRFVC